jgi:hypothetical protein
MENEFITAADVVQLRARGQESVEQGCLKFFRAKQIAHRVSDASESELRHIAFCSDCNARIAAVQRKHENTPARSLERGLDDHDGGFLVRMFAHLLLGYFNAPHHDQEEHAFRAWHGTPALFNIIHHARHTLPSHEVTFIMDASAHALSAAAASWILVPHSFDAVWPVIETVQEGVAAVDGEHLLAPHYVDLVVRVATESPVTVRHLLYWGIFELFDRGEHAAGIAGEVMNRLFHGDYADELMPLAALVIHTRQNVARHLHHEVLSRIPSRSSPFIRSQLDRIDQMTITMKAALACDGAEGAVHTLRAAFSRWFDTSTAHAHVQTLHVVRAAVEHVFADMSTDGEEGRHATHVLTEALFGDDNNRNGRPFFADIKIIEAVRHHHPAAWSRTLADLLEHLPSYKHDGVVRCAVSAYDVTTGDASMSLPRFTFHDQRWSFVAPQKTATDKFWERLASLANSAEHYRHHISWVSAHWDTRRARSSAVNNHSHGVRTRRDSRRSKFAPEERLKKRS